MMADPKELLRHTLEALRPLRDMAEGHEAELYTGVHSRDPYIQRMALVEEGLRGLQSTQRRVVGLLIAIAITVVMEAGAIVYRFNEDPPQRPAVERMR